MDVTTETTPTTAAPEQPAQEPTTNGAAGDAPTSEQLSPFETKLQAILEDPPAEEPEEAADASSEGEDAPAAGADGGAEGAAEEAGEPGVEEDASDADDGAPVIRLPGRQADDPDFEVRVTAELRQALEAQGIDPQQFLERAGQLRNEGMRRRQFEEAMVEIEADRQELAMIERELAERPAEFLTERISPRLLPDVARAVLLRLPDAEFERLLETVSEWDSDPSTRRTAAADARLQSIERRERLQAESAAARQRQDYVRDVARQIIGLVPEDMDDAKANEFFDFAAYKLDQWARSQPQGTRLDPAQVPALLDQLGALAPYGLSTHDQAARASTRDATSDARQNRPADPELAERAKRTGQDLKRRVARKRLAVTTPAGAGAPAADLAPPKGQSFQERISWLEQRLGLKK